LWLLLSLIFIKYYTLQSLPQFLILSFWLVQNLSYLLEASLNAEEGFPTSGNDTENKYLNDALRSLPHASSQRGEVASTRF
jgi:hypothetical protein